MLETFVDKKWRPLVERLNIGGKYPEFCVKTELP